MFSFKYDIIVFCDFMFEWVIKLQCYFYEVTSENQVSSNQGMYAKRKA